MKIIFVIASLVLSLLAIDINIASAEELSSLYGIGSKKASAIITYRSDIKCFSSIEELENVQGIGKNTIAKNRANLSVSSCK